jgi:hypothetical protein
VIAVLGFSLLSIREHLQRSNINPREMIIHFVAVISQASVGVLLLCFDLFFDELLGPELGFYI